MFAELMLDHLYAVKQIQKNLDYKRRVNFIFISLIMITLICQLINIFTKNNIIAGVIMACGIFIFIIDVVMLIRFFISIHRINQLVS